MISSILLIGYRCELGRPLFRWRVTFTILGSWQILWQCSSVIFWFSLSFNCLLTICIEMLLSFLKLIFWEMVEIFWKEHTWQNPIWTAGEIETANIHQLFENSLLYLWRMIVLVLLGSIWRTRRVGWRGLDASTARSIINLLVFSWAANSAANHFRIQTLQR